MAGLKVLFQNGFNIFPNDHTGGKCFAPSGPWQKAFATEMQRRGITNLRLSHSNGWRDDTIAFLADLTFLTGVEIYNWDISDLSPVFCLPKLVHFKAYCTSRKPVNISKISALSICGFHSRSNLIGVEDCPNLTYLNIEGSTDHNFSHYQSLKQLNTLAITSRSLSSLAGIDQIVSLEALDINDGRNLADVTGLAECPKLRHIEIGSCRKIARLPELSHLRHLTTVHLVDDGKIASLAPLFGSTSLTSLSFIGNTDIRDGRLAPLLDLPNLRSLRFGRRRHYDLKPEDLPARYLKV